ncbi:MAG: glycosyltransferase family 1 protein [Bacteroidia bacterium]
MNKKTVNIVSFDVPYPANYGGVIDVFYKLQTLKKSGIDIIFHSFIYGKKSSKELESICQEVHYYQRNTSLLSHFSSLPYIVKSRSSKQLLSNLLSNDYPILFEGLHTTYCLNHPKLKSRKKIVRTHNIEHEYYYSLFSTEKNIIKKLFFYFEHLKLKSYESILKSANAIAAISERDKQHFSKRFSNVQKIYPFHQNQEFLISENQHDFVLYHGNLSVSENIDAVAFLVENVFSKINEKVIIAGANPPNFLVKKIAKHQNITLIENPSHEKMFELKHGARAHILYSKTNSGLKLKLIDALFTAKNIIVNDKIIEREALKNACIVANTPLEIIKTIEHVFSSDLPLLSIENRKKILGDYSNKVNAERLLSLIFN